MVHFSKNSLHHSKRKFFLQRSFKKSFFFLLTLISIIFIVGYVTLASLLGQLRIFLPYWSEITGVPFSQRNYIVIFQNNNELRPAGGFISSFATLSFFGGMPTGFKFEDVYGTIDDHAYQTPPYPMEELLGNDDYQGYTFRDANYYADFPKSADDIIRLVHLTRPHLPIHGVIAVDYSFLEDLFTVISSMEINGKVINSSNLFSVLEFSVNNIDRHNI